jgi:DNA-binding transcriptional ArsR family regulator/YHS domain-containing protein
MYNKIFSLQAKTLKALAHPRRIEIINLIRNQEICCVGTIHKMLDLPQANVSQHLQILRENEIVKTRKKGKKILYSLTNPKIIEACDLIREYLIELHPNCPVCKNLDVDFDKLTPITHCPVCKMRVSPKLCGFRKKYQEQTYYFCASGCYKKFKDNPKAYIDVE